MLNIEVIGDFIKSLKRVEMQDFDVGRRNYEAVESVGFSRYDYELESIFKFLLVFNICCLMQYQYMMSCNMSAIYVPHKKKVAKYRWHTLSRWQNALNPIVSSNETILLNPS
jgi:hypothetical protein